jgi:hypothetical protein
MSDHVERLQSAIADRYVIEREVGRGGMAIVYLARDVRHDRNVAVKVVRPELGLLLGPERFLREIKVVARLQHPHILPIHDSGEADGTLFYVMPYVEDESLRHRLKRDKQLSVAEAVRIASEVASALDHAHRRGVIHRDIKPGNILLVEGHAVVGDFGIARAVHAAGGEMWETITDSGVALGTPAYMSPEQAVGSQDLDARADIYSLGCVLYEMLTGAPPFVGPDGEVLIARRFTEQPPRPSAVRPTVPPEVDQAVVKALAPDPDLRFASAGRFLDVLRASPGRSRELTGLKRRRVSIPVLLAGSAGAVLVGALGLQLTGVWGGNHGAPDDAGGPGMPRPAAIQAGDAPPGPGQPGSRAAVPLPGTAATESAGTGSAVATTPPATPPVSPGPAASAEPGRPMEPRGPARGGPAPHAARAAAPDAEGARLDSVFRSVRAVAQDTRRRAAMAGAGASDLAAGDLAMTDAQTLAASGRWSDAVRRLSTATSSWIDAERAATGPAGDTQNTQDTQRALVERAARPAAPAAARDSGATLPSGGARADIEAALARYARALESRSIADVRQAYPGLTAAQQRSWERFFRDVRTVRASLRIAELDVAGDAAQARIVGTYEYTTDNASQPEAQPVAFRATFRRDAGAWRLSAVHQ